MQEYDVIVVGSGPAGEGASMKLAKLGKHVAVVEMQDQVGGNCTHKGTIPSKALRHAIQLLADYRHHPLFEHTVGVMDVSWPQLLKTSDDVISRQVSMRHRFYTRNRIDVIHGKAHFVDQHTLEVERPLGTALRLRASHFVIATGSRPYRPPELDFGDSRILDSDTVLQMRHTQQDQPVQGRPSSWRENIYSLTPPRPDGQLKNLTGLDDGAVQGLEVSADGERLLFAMKKDVTRDSFHFYEMKVDGTGLRQITFGACNDIDPAYLADERIVFRQTEMELTNSITRRR